VRRLAWILDKSNLLVAPDTGPVHVARALGTPVVSLFAHTNPWRVGPWRAYEDLWVDHYTDPGEEPDPSNRTPKWDQMQTIAVAEVLERIQTAVDKYGVLEPGKL
jgi:heptosyltransferase I